MFAILLDRPEFVVINKPPGIGMHQEGGKPGLVTQVREAFSLSELYPVHRLDKITSGALVLAKTSAANSALSAVFRERRAEKYYIALARKKPSKKQGLVAGDMLRSRRGAWQLAQTENNPAVTQFFSVGIEASLRGFLLKPATGKSHQIRVAMKSLGSPIIGDALYGGAEEGIDRAYLHAWSLGFPFAGQWLDVMAPAQPGELFQRPAIQQWLQSLSQPAQQPWPTLPGKFRSPSSEDETD